MPLASARNGHGSGPVGSPLALEGSGFPPEDWTAPDWAKRQLTMRQQYRTMYHKGFVTDDVDRYGPAVPLIQELHRRIAAAQEAVH